ncbi:MAG: saccharopine dehydrogenase NADP-binding domain-containing protein [Eubacterium sp.]|nr:saccharopine dehydrogenase NADP-binding domain-containing protein [Eubacterium sp.]
MQTEKKKVGILGCSGRIGRALAEELKDKYFLRLGCRNIRRNSLEETIGRDVEYRQVDIEKEDNRRAFIKGLDVVINCAPASWLHSLTLAKSAEEENIIYIDPFGSEELLKEKVTPERKWIIGAGSFPGLSGIYPKYIAAATGIENIRRMDMVAYMNDENTVGAVTDLILSSVFGFGRGNTYYADGTLKKVTEDGRHYDGFDGRLRGSDYMNEETRTVAEELRVAEAHWINMRSEECKKNDMDIQKITMQYIRDKNPDVLRARIGAVIRSQEEEGEHSRKDREKYGSKCQIGCYFTGECEGASVEVKSKLGMDDSNSLNVLVLKQTLKQALEKPDSLGICRAMDFLDPERLMKKVLGSASLQEFFCNVIPATQEGIPEYGEEGEI